MNSRTLRDLFDAVHHGKLEFDGLLHCDVAVNFERVGWAKRTIFRPSKNLKAYHSFLNDFLFDRLPVNDRVSFAYRKGATPHRALERHAEGRAFFQTDVVKFFDSITVEQIRPILLVADTPIQDLRDHIDRILELTTVERRLPIGFSTSPPISNACMKAFDDALELTCRAQNITYTRYADDMMFSAEHRSKFDEFAVELTKLLHDHVGPQCRINATKTRLTTVGRRVKALGMVILPTGRVTIDMSLKRKIEYQLHYLVKNRARLLSIYNNDMEAGLAQLGGHISHVHGADPLYLEKLRKKYGATVIDGLLHRSIT